MNASWKIPLIRRLAFAGCARSDRRWIDDLLGELDAVEGRGPRLRWILGAFGVVIQSNVQALGRLSWMLAAALGLVFVLALILAGGYWQGYELVGADDDLLGVLAVAATVVLFELLRRARSPRADKGETLRAAHVNSGKGDAQ